MNVHTVGNEASKVASDNAMPCGTLALVKCALDVLSNVLQCTELATTLFVFRVGKNHVLPTFSIVNFAIAS
jgi:hypothetical protein